ncbi:MAG: 50S ribosomal protein L22 [Gammaproteobacteria bacterium]|jgi:large subunit ribosomal protein L22|nr:50S ribosomal protein L22 [Gammaproteobacteria bacterium]
MEAKASVSLVRIAPRKARLVLDLVRGKDVDQALAILKNLNRGAAKEVYKVVYAAKANAVNNFNMVESKLYVKECFANEGPTMKRMQPHAKGQGFAILKRTCSIHCTLGERE